MRLKNNFLNTLCNLFSNSNNKQRKISNSVDLQKEIELLNYANEEDSNAQIEAELINNTDCASPDAQAELAKFYLDPRNENSDFYKGMACASSAIKIGRSWNNREPALAQFLLGLICEHYDLKDFHPCFSQEQRDALFWYSKSCEQGFPDACARLGGLYIRGSLAPYDAAKGVDLISQSIKGGSLIGLCLMALCYKSGAGVEKSAKKYIDRLNKSAELGYSNAMFLLGREYAEGEYIDIDESKSLRLFLESAKQNNVWALNRLGYIYLYGELGVEPDEIKAVNYFTKAAGLGCYESMVKAGMYSAIIEDTPVYKLNAYAWLYVAYHIDTSKQFLKDAYTTLANKIPPQNLQCAESFAKDKLKRHASSLLSLLIRQGI